MFWLLVPLPYLNKWERGGGKHNACRCFEPTRVFFLFFFNFICAKNIPTCFSFLFLFREKKKWKCRVYFPPLPCVKLLVAKGLAEREAFFRRRLPPKFVVVKASFLSTKQITFDLSVSLIHIPLAFDKLLKTIIDYRWKVETIRNNSGCLFLISHAKWLTGD